MSWALEYQLLEPHPSLMNWLAFEMLNDLDVALKIHHLWRRENHKLNAVTISSLEVIDYCGSSSIHLHDSPIKESGNNLNRTNSGNMFLKENILQTSTKFLICSWGSSRANPVKSTFSLKNYNIVLVMCNTAFPSAEGKRMSSISPIRWDSLTSVRFPMSSWWPTWLPLLPFTLIRPILTDKQ